jgi:L-seryl-tRNA(Ser) seleniumtransferase
LSRRQGKGIVRYLPKLDRLLLSDELVALPYPRQLVKRVAQEMIEHMRKRIISGAVDEKGLKAELAGLPLLLKTELERKVSLHLRPVINATGVILHTNLGRAPLSSFANKRLSLLSSRYLNLEYDLETGKRGRRNKLLSPLFAALFPGHSALVVNNNAGAVLLILNTFASGKEAIVSRGELVEIGGSFRIPEVMAKSGAILREVGTTNKTRLADYEEAINEETALILSIHPSNYRVLGFTERVPLPSLVELAKKKGVIIAHDMGTGNIMDLRPLGIEDEPSIKGIIETGVDVISFSGDKLLGGPQAGVIVGRNELIVRLEKNPLYRVLRPGKLTLIALSATLRGYLLGEEEALPAVRMLRMTKGEVSERASKLQAKLEERLSDRAHFTLKDGESKVGGGTVPLESLLTKLIEVEGKGLSPDELARRMRRRDIPVIARIEGDRLVIDLRTVFPEEEEELLQALSEALKPGSG